MNANDHEAGICSSHQSMTGLSGQANPTHVTQLHTVAL